MTEELIEPVPEPVPNGDLCLRFADEAEATAALDDYPGSIDIIGVIYKPTGVMIETDEGEVPEMAAVDGWHVNTRGPMPAELLPYAVHPEHPVRVWA
jgi:hypothetical protein